jgi:hypothetical protein
LGLTIDVCLNGGFRGRIPRYSPAGSWAASFLAGAGENLEDPVDAG